MAKKNIKFPEIKLASKKEKKLFIECMKNDDGNSSFNNWNSTKEKVENKFNKLVKKSLFQYIDLEKEEPKYFFILDDQLGKDGTHHIYYFKSSDDTLDINKAISKFLKFLYDEENIENIILHVNSLDNDTFSILGYNKVMQFENSLYYVSGTNEKGEDEWSKLEKSLKDIFINIDSSKEQSNKNDETMENVDVSSSNTNEAAKENQNIDNDVVKTKNDESIIEEVNDSPVEELSSENIEQELSDISNEEQSLEKSKSNNFETNDELNIENNNDNFTFAEENLSSEQQDLNNSTNDNFVNLDLSEENLNIENNEEIVSQEPEYQQNLDKDINQEHEYINDEQIKQQEYNKQLEKENLEKSKKWAEEFYQLPGEDTNGILSTKERFPQKEFIEYDPLDISKISYDLKSLSTLKIKSDNAGNNDYNTSNFSAYEEARKNVLEGLENLKKTNKKGHDSIDTIGISKNPKEETLSEKSNSSIEEMKKRLDVLKEKINN